MKRASIGIVALALLAAGCSDTVTTAGTSSPSSATKVQTVALSVASMWSIADTDSVDITGTSQPGAAIHAFSTVGTALVQADSVGQFDVHLGPFPLGDTNVDITATAAGYGNAGATVTVHRTISPDKYKSSAASIPYVQLIKDPDSFKGRIVTYRGKVFQYDSATTTSHFLLSVTDKGYGFWDDNVLVDVDPAIAQNVFKDTMVTICGEVVGAYSYTNTLGGKISVPEINVRYLAVG
ncbi:MAG TPA: hypothetical protein VF160_08180 [Candidatus Dormibacteraeota bacterium]